jgi:hypothetical protein
MTSVQDLQDLQQKFDEFQPDSYQMHFAILRMYKYCPCVCFEFIEQLSIFKYLDARKLKHVLDTVYASTRQSSDYSNNDDISYAIVAIDNAKHDEMLSIGAYKYEAPAPAPASTQPQPQPQPQPSDHRNTDKSVAIDNTNPAPASTQPLPQPSDHINPDQSVAIDNTNPAPASTQPQPSDRTSKDEIVAKCKGSIDTADTAANDAHEAAKAAFEIATQFKSWLEDAVDDTSLEATSLEATLSKLSTALSAYKVAMHESFTAAEERHRMCTILKDSPFSEALGNDPDLHFRAYSLVHQASIQSNKLLYDYDKSMNAVNIKRKSNGLSRELDKTNLLLILTPTIEHLSKIISAYAPPSPAWPKLGGSGGSGNPFFGSRVDSKISNVKRGNARTLSNKHPSPALSALNSTGLEIANPNQVVHEQRAIDEKHPTHTPDEYKLMYIFEVFGLLFKYIDDSTKSKTYIDAIKKCLDDVTFDQPYDKTDRQSCMALAYLTLQHINAGFQK